MSRRIKFIGIRLGSPSDSDVMRSSSVSTAVLPPQTTIPVKFTTGYFKAGVYTQANCGNSSPCDTSNYGETTLYNVSVKHS
ncbi:hypothetical protein ACIBBB_07945 [Streptomyces sp. NPDC051217]|uniref:hypothetical protein n=1 Tax=Streptomyces sp. NPDC051217 TaxID=3365644 RepID=UPI0037A1DAA5